jgi:cysteinyl-tRNA synthetase
MIAMLAVWLEAQPGPQPAAVDTRETIAPYVSLLAETRQKLRATKQFALADELRNALGNLGVSIEDTATGPVVSFTRG